MNSDGKALGFALAFSRTSVSFPVTRIFFTVLSIFITKYKTINIKTKIAASAIMIGVRGLQRRWKCTFGVDVESQRKPYSRDRTQIASDQGNWYLLVMGVLCVSVRNGNRYIQAFQWGLDGRHAMDQCPTTKNMSGSLWNLNIILLKLPVSFCSFSRYFHALFPVTSAIIFLTEWSACLPTKTLVPIIRHWALSHQSSVEKLQSPQLLRNWLIFRLKTPQVSVMIIFCFLFIVIQTCWSGQWQGKTWSRYLFVLCCVVLL